MDYELRTPEVTPVNDHVWLLNDHGTATCYVVAGAEKAMVIDTSVGLCDIAGAARALTALPLICVNTHGHWDHFGGNWSFDRAWLNSADWPIAREELALPEVQQAVREMGIRYPDFESLEDGMVFDLGGLSLEALALPGHTPGQMVLLDRADRLLFTGDAVIEHLWLQLEESPGVKTQIESMERLLPLRDSFDRVLTGHGSGPVDAELFDTMLEALRAVDRGETENDIDYEWHGNVSRAYPYQPNDRRIVHK